MSTIKNQNASRTAQASATTASIASAAANALPPIVPIKYNEAIIDLIRSPINNRLTPIESGGEVQQGVLVFQGRATPNSQVIIYDNGNKVAIVKVNSSGTWVYDSNAFTDGEHHFTVQVLSFSEETPISASYDISIPAQPEQPVLIAQAIDDSAGYAQYLKSGSTTNDTTPRFTGSAKPNSLVKVFDGNQEIGSVQANAYGQWSFTAKLDGGAHSLTFVSGKTSSEPFILNIVTPEAQPIEILYVYDDSHPYVPKNLKSGDTTQDTTPRFEGKAEANTLIRLFDGGKEIGSTVSDARGLWSLTPSLSAGSHSLVFKAGEGSDSKPFEVTIALAEAQPIEILYVYDDSHPYVPKNLKSGDTTQDTTPRFEGKAGANTLIRLFDGSKEIGSTLSDAWGNWSLTPSLSAGSHSLVFKAGEGSDSKPFEVTIALAEAQPVDVYGIYQDINGWNERIFGETTQDTTPRFAGTSAPNVVIYMYNGDKVLGSAQADYRGNWSLTPELQYGSYNFVFKTAEGTSSAPVSITIAAPEVVKPQAPEIEFIFDNVGKGGYIEKNGTTDDDTPTLSGTAAPNSLVEIFDNGVKIGERRVSTGYWEFTPVNPAYLVNGTHSFVVKSSNGTETAPWDIIIKVPVNVTLIGSNSGEYTGDHETDDTTPFISGRGPKGVLIRLYEGDKEIGSVVTSKYNGSWKFDFTTPLSAGEHTIVAKAGSDNVSAEFDFSIIAPEVPVEPENPFVITQVSDEFFNTGVVKANGQTDDNQPRLHGQAPANTLVRIFDHGVEIGSTMANSTGAWAFKPEVSLSLGKHAITIGASANDASEAFAFDVVAAQVFAPYVLGGISEYDGVENFAYSANIYDNTPVLNGVAQAGSIVNIAIDDKFIGTTIADQYGRWSFQTTEALTAGAHEVVATDVNGNKGVSLTFSLVDPRDIDIKFGVYDDSVGEAFIVPGSVTNDATPLLRGLAGQNIVLEIYDNNERVGSVRTAQDGSWSFQLDLANGAHSITVKSEYLESVLPRHFTVDADTVTIDTITGRYFDYDNSQPSGGEPINDNRIVLFGSAPADATVQVLTTDGRSLGYTGASLNGKWYLEVDSRFEDGTYSVIAKVNGVESEPFIFQIGERTAIETQEDTFNLFDISGAELLSTAEETLLVKEVEAVAQPVNLDLTQADLSVVTTSGIATSTVAAVALQDEQYQAI